MKSQGRPVWNEYVAGAIGGCAGLLIGYPLDTAKVQLQLNGPATYKSSWDALKVISNHGMVKGFFRGLSFPLMAYGLINSVYFGVYEYSLHYFTNTYKCKPSYQHIFLAGAMGGVMQLSIACPFDVIKVVLQSQIASQKLKDHKFTKPIECIQEIKRQRGIRGFYHGVSCMFVRDVPASGIYMLSYQALIDLFREYCAISGFHVNVISGGIAGTLSWLYAMPADVIKSIVQSTVLDPKLDISYRQLCLSAYQRHGIAFFYRGTIVTCARGFPVNAITLAVYTEALKYFNNRCHPQ